MKLYSYNKCGTCRKAIRFLEDRKVKFELFDITENPPTKQILKSAMKAKGLKLSDHWDKEWFATPLPKGMNGQGPLLKF